MRSVGVVADLTFLALVQACAHPHEPTQAFPPWKPPKGPQQTCTTGAGLCCHPSVGKDQNREQRSQRFFASLFFIPTRCF